MHLSAAYQHQNEFVENLSLAQRERLAFIDFNLQFFGRISRSDLKPVWQPAHVTSPPTAR
jgi:hypothetical protein